MSDPVKYDHNGQQIPTCRSCGRQLQYATEIAAGYLCAECGPGSWADQQRRRAAGMAPLDATPLELQRGVGGNTVNQQAGQHTAIDMHPTGYGVPAAPPYAHSPFLAGGAAAGVLPPGAPVLPGGHVEIFHPGQPGHVPPPGAVTTTQQVQHVPAGGVVPPVVITPAPGPAPSPPVSQLPTVNMGTGPAASAGPDVSAQLMRAIASDIHDHAELVALLGPLSLPADKAPADTLRRILAERPPRGAEQGALGAKPAPTSPNGAGAGQEPTS